MGGCNGGKSFGCSQTCVCGSTRPPVISAQKGQVAVPSRRFMRCGALTRYWRAMGFLINAVSASISLLCLLSSPGPFLSAMTSVRCLAAEQYSTPLTRRHYALTEQALCGPDVSCDCRS